MARGILGVMLVAAAAAGCGHVIEDPDNPGPNTTVFVEVTCVRGHGRVTIESKAWHHPSEAEIAEGATASTVVGFWGRAAPITVKFEGKVIWEGPVTTSLKGPNHLRLVIDGGSVSEVIAEMDPALDGRPSYPERQQGHVAFKP